MVSRRSSSLTVRIVNLTGFSAFLSACLLPVSTAHAARLDIGTFTRLAKQCAPQVAPLTLAALAKIESRFDPLTIFDNTARRSHRYSAESDAVKSAKNFIMRGHSIDVGLMQINSANIRRLGMTLKSAFDPCRSISGAASILSRNYDSVRGSGSAQAALLNAISMYNTGSSVRGFRNGYVRKVQAAASKLVPASEPSSSTIENSVVKSTDDPTDDSPGNSWDVWRSTGARKRVRQSEPPDDKPVAIFGGLQ